jgi:DNA-binding NtrC family response regulator
MDATLPPSTGGTGGTGGGCDDGARVPGLVVVFSAGAPAARVLPATAGPLELGRGDAGAGKLEDGRVSRRHAAVAFAGGRCTVTDLGSQNGTFVDGALVAANAPVTLERVLRVGDSLLLPCADVRPFQRTGVRSVDGFVRGPAMQAVLEAAAQAARGNGTLHIRGETGSGKEGVAQAFHRAGRRAAGPLVAVNCAAIPAAIAERLLFGARRGAFSGADDAPGYLLEADGGTLFLDEVAELDLQVQAKLLRVLESRELLAVGASKPRTVDVAFCSATNADLRAMVAAGKLREDLYFRIGRPAVLLPALRDRPEEIPALIVHALAAPPGAAQPRGAGAVQPAGPTAHVSLVEQCLLRPWPGNVRELVTEVRTAALAALDGRVEARHLAASAGSAFGAAPVARARPAEDGDAAEPEARPAMARDDAAWRDRIDAALRANAGNVAAAARSLGLHRTQLRRLIARHGLAVEATDRGHETDE